MFRKSPNFSLFSLILLIWCFRPFLVPKRRVVSSSYWRLLMVLSPIFMLIFDSPSSSFLVITLAYRLNKKGGRINLTALFSSPWTNQWLHMHSGFLTMHQLFLWSSTDESPVPWSLLKTAWTSGNFLSMMYTKCCCMILRRILIVWRMRAIVQ